MKTKFRTRLVSLVLCLALIFAYLPAAATAIPMASDKTADPSTMDGWKDLYLSQPLNTENAGKVWTDKSVFTDASAFQGTGITQSGDNSFLVALSAMASNMTVTGISNVPTDTMMILDLSSSMYSGSSRDPSVVKLMLSSVNDTIDKLQKLNEHNRVGVVIYYGGQDRNQSDASNSMVLLPLDRYSGTTTYLKANVSSNRLISVAVNSGVKNSAGATVSQTTRTVTDVAGTYAQLGILDAMNQLLGATTTAPVTADHQQTITRVPVMIFMSDGEPTAATHQYTKKVTAGMGNNTVSIRNPNETDFVTQLTAAYAKQMVDAHYVQTTPLFYTLSLGNSVSLSVMDPANHTTGTIDGYWTKLLSNGSVGITVQNSPNGWSAPTVTKNYTVSRTTVNGAIFPADKSQRNYVDKAFTAATAGDLTSAFGNIVNMINLMSKYTPTLTSGNADLSGYISFVDKVGQYMDVTDIKGVLINNTLYSGVDLAKNFVESGGELGTYDAPTALGEEMVHAVQARLGIDDLDTAQALIGLAYRHGQLSYTSPTEYSNYIGWYANAAGKFLGFWHEGTTTIPAATGEADTDPAFIIKSYGYLGAVDESHGVEASDMMYATVQIRTNIATGEQSVVFAVPAALIPILTYEAALDQNNALTELKVTGAEHPIRLVYEVALDPQINSFNLTDMVSPEYLAANTDEDGKVSFYTNQYEADHTVGYGKVNTYSYFNPSRQNDKYYYIEDTPVLSDTQGTLYTGDTQPAGVYYRRYTVYEKNGTALSTKILYRQLSDAALATAKQAPDGSWYIGTGNVRVNLEGYTVTKTENTTNTLPDAYIPFVDAHNHSVGDLGYNFIVGATLGNNGRLRILPETGILLSKTMAEGATAPTGAFHFTITHLDHPEDNGTYPAQLLPASGTPSDTTVRFTAGKATIILNPGEGIYIGGMRPGDTYHVAEVPTVEYVPQTENFTVTLKQGEMSRVHFINADRGKGDLAISKEVVHPLGGDYQIPGNRSFTMDVTLTGVGVANSTFDATHTGGTITSVTTDDKGHFTVTLGHREQVKILGLPAGTTATVAEQNPGEGFTPSYQEEGQSGDGVVSIRAKETASVTVTNRYEPDEVTPANLVLRGTKALTTAASGWNGAAFEIVLQKQIGESWNTIATATVSESSPTFDFSDALRGEIFTAPGTYHYQVIETHGGETIDGITYDATVYPLTITVTDMDMDGKLEIHTVTASNQEIHPNRDGHRVIELTFHNRYDATGTDLVLEVQKELVNPSESPLVDLSGFCFGLYNADTLLTTSDPTDSTGQTRLFLHYELEDVGTHTYTLKELIPDLPIRNMTYSTAVYTLVVEVVDNGDGTTSAAIVSMDSEDEIPVFTNRYYPDYAVLTIDFVEKKLTGRDLVSGEFTFALRGEGTTILGTNNAAGHVVFENALVFNTVGTRYYELVEISTDGKGVTTDQTVYPVTVTVTDENGTLVASYRVANTTDNTVLFENTYTAKETAYTISGEKQLTGRALLNEEFTFVLTDEAGNPMEEVKNFADGAFSFTPIRFTEAGTYRYSVWEKAAAEATYGVTYDTTVYQVAITVIDDRKGNLVVAQVDISGDGTITFTNHYTPAPTWAQIDGDKTLSGKVLGSGDFSFELYASDENGAEGRLLETVTNGADGIFTFSRMDYSTVGTYHYLVKETNGGETIRGITYDDSVYHVTIHVTDDLLGQLHAAVQIRDHLGMPRQDIGFLNTYTITGNATVTLEGTKTLNGKDLTDGAFTFELYGAEEDFTVIGEALETAVNTDGRFALNLNYTAEDVGSTFHYVVREQHSGQTIEGVTYSSTEYQVTVQVEDDTVGGIRTTATITDNGTPVGALDFVNEYQAGEVTVDFSGTKVLQGKDLTQGAFSFELYETDESWELVSEGEVVANREDGSFAFTPITFTTVGTRYYIIQETNGGKTMDNVTYDGTVYRITVDVTDDLKGQLVYTMDIRTDQGDVRETIAFENTYTPDPDSITVDIRVVKTVKNLGTKSIGPEGFEFRLEDVTNGTTRSVKSDGKGQAAFTLTFSKEDIGKTYRYKLTEVHGNQEGVQYSTAVYDITVSITHSEDNKLVATITNNGAATAEVVAAFENTYTPEDPKEPEEPKEPENPKEPKEPDTPTPTNIPKTSDRDMTLWVIMLALSCGGVITLAPWYKKFKDEEA